jgi:hypothetical protein
LSGSNSSSHARQNLVDIVHRQAHVVQAIGIPAGSAIVLGAGEHLEILRVGDPQVHQPDTAIVLVEPQHLGKTELVDIVGERSIDVRDLDRDMADAGDSLHVFLPWTDRSDRPGPTVVRHLV